MWKLVGALVLSSLVASGSALAQPKSAKGGYDQLNLFGEAFDRIRQDAVEPVADTKLVGAAIAGMLSGLDARSAYIDEAAFRAMQSPANDNLTGLGLVVTIDNGQLKVISPQDGSLAATAGVKPGDLIYAIDKEPTYDLTLSEAEQKLQEVHRLHPRRRRGQRHGHCKGKEAPRRPELLSAIGAITTVRRKCRL